MWFAEDALSPAFLLLAIALGVFAAARSARMSARRSTLVTAALLLAIAAFALFPIERAIVTDRERVTSRVHAAADAARANDADRLLQFIATRAPDLHESVREGIDRVYIEDDLEISDLSVEMKQQNTRTITRFLAKATVRVDSMSGRAPTRWELTWLEESGQWKIMEVRRLSYINGEEIDIFALH